MQIGVTERGDAGIDLSWVEKLETVDGVILITKKLTDGCIEKILENKEKIILHLTCTGFGGSILEPNVPEYKKQIEQCKKLIEKGFSSYQIVLRIDPIIPTEKGLITAQTVLDYTLSLNLGIQRVRISVIDMYPHVRERFVKKGVPLPYGESFSASTEQFRMVNNWVRDNKAKYKNVSFECCAENRLHFAEQVGCVSNKDLGLLGLKRIDTDSIGFQRNGCLCLGCKTELLENKTPCKHQCLYCYWKTPEEVELTRKRMTEI